MEFRPLDITVISAEGLKNVNIFMKMGVYVVVSLINGDYVSKHKTHTSSGGCNPKWSHRIKFSVEECSIYQTTLLFVLKCSCVLGNKDIGEVSIPVRELLEASGNPDNANANAGEQVVNYQVRTLSGKCKGTLTFSHKFGEKFTQELESVTQHKKNKQNEESVKNNATGSSTPCQQNPRMVYAMPPYPQVTYPPPQGYGAYPPLPHYGGGYGTWYADPTQPCGYVYLTSGQLVGYTYQPMEQPTKEKKTSGGGTNNKVALGVGEGLTGGLMLVGDMVQDVEEKNFDAMLEDANAIDDSSDL